ncbi:MAG: large-conductance mechanosensitive channel protein MscL [Bacteroidota bacterium]
MWNEFKEFAVKGNVVDMAVGIIIGAAFGTIVKALVDGILMPPLGLLLGDVDFANIFTVLKQGDPAGPYATLEAATAAGAVTMSWGVFINTVISFLIVAFAVFIFVKWVNNLKREAEEEVAEEPAAPELTADQQLLTEIRDLLKQPDTA